MSEADDAPTITPATRIALREVIKLRKENVDLREACREALAFMTAPANSPRLWPTSRGNLTKMLAKALGEEP